MKNLKMALLITTVLTLCFAGMSFFTGCDSLTGSDGGTAATDGGGSGTDGGGSGSDGGGTCTPACDGKACGEDNGCSGKCTACPEGETCNKTTWACEAGTCTPDCTGLVCGEDDGCGGMCYDCPDGEGCNEETWTCESLGNCGAVSFQGCCDGEVATYCEGGEVMTIDCAANTDPAKQVCGWSSTTDLGDIYDCGGDGEDPSGQSPIACP